MAMCCDICGKRLTRHKAELVVYDLNDGYNTDDMTYSMDICHDCLFEMISKDDIFNEAEREGQI